MSTSIRPVPYSIPSGLRCPKCFGRLFTISPIQSIGRTTIWECQGCSFDGEETDLKDRTPPGSIAVTPGVEWPCIQEE